MQARWFARSGVIGFSRGIAGIRLRTSLPSCFEDSWVKWRFRLTKLSGTRTRRQSNGPLRKRRLPGFLRYPVKLALGELLLSTRGVRLERRFRGGQDLRLMPLVDQLLQRQAVRGQQF